MRVKFEGGSLDGREADFAHYPEQYLHTIAGPASLVEAFPEGGARFIRVIEEVYEYTLWASGGPPYYTDSTGRRVHNGAYREEVRYRLRLPPA